MAHLTSTPCQDIQSWRQIQEDVLQAILKDVPLTPHTRTGHDPPLVVKVAQHNEKTLVLLSEYILNGDLDFVEGDVGRSGGGGVGRLDGLGLDAFAALDEEDRDSFLYSGGTIGLE